ncbi:hypothetical protein [Nonomuraea rubra]|uniref:hypothetical protein n=1 Tax=Nonomuraea rubra TaxID=46180 RepID=UPI0031EF9A64
MTFLRSGHLLRMTSVSVTPVEYVVRHDHRVVARPAQLGQVLEADVGVLWAWPEASGGDAVVAACSTSTDLEP